MFNAKRMAKYLATGVMPERTALDAAIARYSEVMDAIDFAAHDRRYHGGKYDPDTMTCGMRQALEKGDLADVLAAEEEEGRERQRFIKDRPDEITDEEFLAYYGKPNEKGQRRLAEYLTKKYVPCGAEGVGTLVGLIGVTQVFAHKKFSWEFSHSKNSRYLMKYDKEKWKTKVGVARGLSSLIKQAVVTSRNVPLKHKSGQHQAWQIEKGFAYAESKLGDQEVRFIFTETKDGRFLLYDVIV